jgi:hypothetical protein
VIVTGVTVAIIAGFVLHPYAIVAWNVTRQFVDSIRNAIGG